MISLDGIPLSGNKIVKVDKIKIGSLYISTLLFFDIFVSYKKHIYSPLVLIALIEGKEQEHCIEDILLFFGFEFKDRFNPMIYNILWLLARFKIKRTEKIIMLTKSTPFIDIFSHITNDKENISILDNDYVDISYFDYKTFLSCYGNTVVNARDIFVLPSCVKSLRKYKNVMHITFDCLTSKRISKTAEKYEILYTENYIDFVEERKQILSSFKYYEGVFLSKRNQNMENFNLNKYYICNLPPLTYMTDKNISENFEVPWNASRKVIITNIYQNYFIPTWRFMPIKYALNKNDETINLDIRNKLIQETLNKDDYLNNHQSDNDLWFSYGYINKYVSFQASELLEMCEGGLDTFSFYTPTSNSELGLGKEFNSKQIKVLYSLVIFLLNNKEFYRKSKTLISLHETLKPYINNNIKIYHKKLFNFLAKQSENTLNNLFTFIYFSIFCAVWIRFWKGPGYSIPYHWRESKSENGYDNNEYSCVVERDTNLKREINWFNEWYNSIDKDSKKAISKVLVLQKYEGKLKLTGNNTSVIKVLRRAFKGKHCLAHTSDIILTSISPILKLVNNLKTKLDVYSLKRYNKCVEVDIYKFEDTRNIDISMNMGIEDIINI